MKYDVKFRNLDYSESLVAYVHERFDKIKKFEIKPVTVHVTFSQVRHRTIANIYIHGMMGDFRARSESDSFQVSLDMCLKKIERQMEKQKSRIKHHKNFELSAEAELNAQLQSEKNGIRKAV